jgi:hypothetical protein
MYQSSTVKLIVRVPTLSNVNRAHLHFSCRCFSFTIQTYNILRLCDPEWHDTHTMFHTKIRPLNYI